MKILDACCGSKMFWYEKSEPHTTFVDIRREIDEVKDRDRVREVRVEPDLIADFRHLPFTSYQFDLVVFDPPHLVKAGKTSWLATKYGVLNKDTWKDDLKAGFDECMRVLRLDGILLFKWSNTDIPHNKVLKVLGQQPILGDKRGHTRWSVFIKPNEDNTPSPSFTTEYIKEQQHDKA